MATKKSTSPNKKPHPGSENLVVPTSEQARRNGRLGGLKRAENERKRRSMKEVLQALLDLPMREKDTPEELKSFADFAQGKNVTIEQAILMAQIIKGIKGDTRAATFLRDTAGEKILKDASESNTEFEDDGFTEALKASAKGVWDDDK